MHKYVIIISRYEHDIQVIAQDRGKAEVAGDDLDIMRVNRDITNFSDCVIVARLIKHLSCDDLLQFANVYT